MAEMTLSPEENADEIDRIEGRVDVIDAKQDLILAFTGGQLLLSVLALITTLIVIL